MKSQKGVIHLILPLLFLGLVGAAIFLLFYLGIIKNPLSKLPSISLLKKEPTVSLQTAYNNPFDKSSQYVNPFASYKNPFDALK